MSEALTRRTRPLATQNPNLPAWVMVTDPNKRRFHFNLTPAAAEDLGNELIRVATTARASNQETRQP